MLSQTCILGINPTFYDMLSFLHIPKFDLLIVCLGFFAFVIFLSCNVFCKFWYQGYAVLINIELGNISSVFTSVEDFMHI